MKKLLLIACILGICSAASAQSFTFGYEDRSLNAGDTIVYTFNDNDIQVDYKFTNNSNDTISLQVTVNTIDAEGFDVYGVCAGDCMPGNVSPVFKVAPGETYTGCDARIEASRNAERGVFTVTAANVNDANDAVTVYMILEMATSIETAQAAQLNTYPNPASELTNISYVLPENMNNGKLVLTNMLGSVVKVMDVNSHQGSVVMHLNDLSAGIYNLAVMAGNKMMGNSKIIVK